jgi:hypothetical protein
MTTLKLFTNPQGSIVSLYHVTWHLRKHSRSLVGLAVDSAAPFDMPYYEHLARLLISLNPSMLFSPKPFPPELFSNHTDHENTSVTISVTYMLSYGAFDWYHVTLTSRVASHPTRVLFSYDDFPIFGTTILGLCCRST